MVDFRKSFLLATMALAIGVGTASAQQGNCAATTGAPPTLRQEGAEELTGAFVISCTGVSSSTVNFDVTLNNATLPITSRAGEAIVLVSNAGGAPLPYYGTVVSTGIAGSTAFNDVRFTGIQITSTNPVITFTGIRTNAGLVIPNGGLGAVDAVVSVSNGVLPVTQPGAGLFVGIVSPALGVLTTSGPITSACGTVTTLNAGVNFTVGIPELFPTAFKAQGPVPGTSAGINADSETGPNPTYVVPATNATQFKVTFANVPSGVTFYVPQTIFSTAGGASAAYLVAGEGSVTAVQGTDVSGSGVLYVAVISGTPLYYNVAVSNPSVTETFLINVYTPTSTVSGAFNTTVTVALAPTTTTFPLVLPVPSYALVPRFNPETAPAAPSTFTSSGTTCQTSLLYPFVSNQSGFDTGISIAATGTDPFGTSVGGGTCTIYMYGLNAPATPPTLTVGNASEGHTTVSAIAPNFQGYAIAVCPFTYAHGYAFISDGFMGAGRGLSEGYVAKVIDYRPTASSAIFDPTQKRAESLGN